MFKVTFCDLEARAKYQVSPYAFTEHGAIMAANAEILKRLAEIDKKLLLHDTALRDIYLRLQPLLQPPPDAPKPKIGFKETAPRYGERRRARPKI